MISQRCVHDYWDNMALALETIKKLVVDGEMITPGYIYDEATIRAQAQKVKESIQQEGLALDVYYAMKANPNIAIMNILKDEGFGVDIASGGELYAANKVGFDPKKIIYTGPSKSDDELREAVEIGIETIHVESVNEAERLDAICAELGKKQDILIRVNATYEIHGVKVSLSGDSTQFGIMQEVLPETIQQLKQLQHINITGLHVYNASGVLDYKALVQNVENVFSLIQELESNDPDVAYKVIDFGGGFGIDYSGDEEFNVDGFIKGTKELVTKFGYEDRTLKMEIGRYLVADAGEYVTTIRDIKESRGVTFLITDGGVHHQLRPALIGANHPTALVQQTPTEEKTTYRVSGVLCTNLDVIARDVELPTASIGDLVLVRKSGAYSWSESMQYFLSHKMAPEYLYTTDGEIKVIREQGTYEDTLRGQQI